MHAQSRELFRVCLLQALNAQTAYALNAGVLHVQARLGGHNVTEAEVVQEMLYLTDKGLAVEDNKTLSPEVKRWRITANGRDFLAEQQLG